MNSIVAFDYLDRFFGTCEFYHFFEIVFISDITLELGCKNKLSAIAII
jgi:hypothetical protein